MTTHRDTRPSGTGSAGASAATRAAILARRDRHRRIAISAGAGVFAGMLAGWLLAWPAGLLGGGLVAGLAFARLRRRADAATWRRGAAGERRTARKLRPLTRHGWVVLHDRALPGSKANIDHLAVGPAGVFLVDSKQWSANVRYVRGRLRVGRVGGPTIVRGVLHETRVATRVLRGELGTEVPITPLLAVHGARLPVWRRVWVDGVELVAGRRVRHRLRAGPTVYTPDDVARIAAAADRALPTYRD